METVADFIFGGSKSLQMLTAARKLKDTVLEEMRKKCVINSDALDIDVVYRLDLVYLQDDEDTDEEDGE